MKISTDPNKIREILERGTEDIIEKDHLEKQLLFGKQLRVKFGIDPTGPKIHLGRAVPLRKLKAFQDLGHQIVLIVGDFTATLSYPCIKGYKHSRILTSSPLSIRSLKFRRCAICCRENDSASSAVSLKFNLSSHRLL